MSRRRCPTATTYRYHQAHTYNKRNTPPNKTEIIGNTVILIYEEPMFGEWITINIKGNYTKDNYLCWEAPKYLIPALGEDEVNAILINYCPNQLNQ
ncbi:hypothetical protein [Vulcanisaeta distributa]|nr:hypothetical protein [Vulcanisaeta distributa]